MSHSNNRMASYRARMREAGLRPVQIWVPDTQRPGFKEEVARQAALAASSEDDRRVLEEIAAIADFGEW